MDKYTLLDVLVGCIGSLSLLIFSGISGQLKLLTGSVNELAIKIAVVIEKTENHENRLKRLEERKHEHH